MDTKGPIFLAIAAILAFILGVFLPPSKNAKTIAAEPWKPKVLWEKQAKRFGADISRVQVWDALSDMFLDTTWEEGQLEWLAEIIAESPFSFQELGHILFFEVAPVCSSNLLWIAGEWAAFSPNWLIPQCLKRQKQHPFHSRGRSDRVRFFVHILGIGPASEAYFLLFRAQRKRA